MAKVTDWPDQWIGDVEDGKAKAREAEGGVSMELKPAREVATDIYVQSRLVDHGDTAPAFAIIMTESRVRADRLAVLEWAHAWLIARGYKDSDIIYKGGLEEMKKELP